MKKILLLPVLLLIFSGYKSKPYKAFDILNDTLVVPANGIHLYGRIFIEDAEVMNVHYLEYLHFLAQDSSMNHAREAYPDTNIFGVDHRDDFIKNFKAFYKEINNEKVFHRKLHHEDEYRKGKHHTHWYNYFSYVETKNFPVVGISYEQAVKYCQWRTQHVTDYFRKVLAGQKHYRKLAGYDVLFLYRLPTEQEWELAASAGLDVATYPYGTQHVKIKPMKIYVARDLLGNIDTNVTLVQLQKDINLYQSDSILNFNCLDRKKPYFEDKEVEPEFIYHNEPNRLAIYNAIGNVAEMLQEKGIAKGGSYSNKLVQCAIQQRQTYSKPERWLGFRPVCEVFLIKKPSPKP